MLIKEKPLRILAGCGFFIMLALLFIGGHQPASGHLFTPPWDKVAHFSFFATLTLLGAIAFIRLPLALLGIMVMALGGADEIHQLFVPGRHAGLDDWAADATGCVLALMVAFWLRKQLVLYFKQA
ncbi:MAG TPA: VanZ family protein [Methylotenera sp.]|nr:VanZ family protein [Methylotenera sp.]